MDVWRERSLRATIVFLVASALLIGPSLVGLKGSLPLFVGFVALAIGAGLARKRLADLPTVVGHELGTYGQDLWIAPVIALGIVLAIVPSASPAELQALGGAAGLVGMLNYFLRPIYLGIARILRRFVGDESPQGSAR